MLWCILAFVVVVPMVYLWGAYSYRHEIPPMPQILKWRDRNPEPIGVEFDKYQRLVAYPEKIEVPCPLQDDRVLVLLTIGQSNAANTQGQRHSSAHGARVLNYFRGKCYVAASPLLGANGAAGESWTLLGNKLIDAGYERVVIVASAIGSTPVRRWQRGGDLNTMLLSALDGLPFRITHVLWHQGEDDARDGTSKVDYMARFRSLVDSLRAKGIRAPVFVSVGTRCGLGPWNPDNPTAQAQRALPDGKDIFAGPDTDALMQKNDRFEDCHFSATGQEKFAAEWVRLITKAM